MFEPPLNDEPDPPEPEPMVRFYIQQNSGRTDWTELQHPYYPLNIDKANVGCLQ